MGTFNTSFVFRNTDAAGDSPSLSERLTPPIEQFKQLAKYISQKIRVAVPAIVLSFNAEKGTITAQIAVNEKVQWNNPANESINVQVQNMLPGGMDVLGNTTGAVIPDIPVCLFGAGGWTFTLPIQEGDECLLLFSDTEIDMWFQNGGNVGGNGQTPIESRRHDLSDAIAIFGLRSTPHLLPDYSTDSAQIRNDDQTIYVDLNSNTSTVTVVAPNVVVESGNVTINAANNVVVNSTNTTVNSTNATINATNNAIVMANAIGAIARGTITISGSTVNVMGTSAINVTAPTISMTGTNIGLAGSISMTGTVTLQGKSWLSHTHNGVTVGTGVTGVVT